MHSYNKFELILGTKIPALFKQSNGIKLKTENFEPIVT